MNAREWDKYIRMKPEQRARSSAQTMLPMIDDVAVKAMGKLTRFLSDLPYDKGPPAQGDPDRAWFDDLFDNLEHLSAEKRRHLTKCLDRLLALLAAYRSRLG